MGALKSGIGFLKRYPQNVDTETGRD